MNITFFIGNGFDINMGLNTKYEQFYPYFIEHAKDNKIAAEIKSNGQDWSDFELALGKYAGKLDKKEHKAFAQDKIEAERLLAEYIKMEEGRVGSINEELLGEFKEKLLGFSTEMSTKDKRQFNSMLKKYGLSNSYRFVNFNYSSTLDKIVMKSRRTGSLYVKKVDGKTYKDLVEMPLHIHGTVKNNMVLGINDLSQFNNLNITSRMLLSKIMIKPDINESVGELNNDSALNLINSSHYICIFGMSKGATDCRWWTSIAGWLANNPDRRLILYYLDKTADSPSTTRRITNDSIEIDDFLGKCNVMQNIKERIESQIIAIPNTKVFTYENIVVNPKEANTGGQDKSSIGA